MNGTTSNTSSKQKFYCDIFQVADQIPEDTNVACLCDELLGVADDLLGIIHGNVPDDATIALAAKFIVGAAHAGYRSIPNERTAKLIQLGGLIEEMARANGKEVRS